MSEFELYATFNEVVAIAESYNDRFMALLFAFLVASYLVAAKLDRVIASIVVILYSAMVLRYGFVYFNVTGDVIALADELRERAAQSGSSLSWLEIGPVHILYYGVLTLYALSGAASVAFFVYMRGREPQTIGME